MNHSLSITVVVLLGIAALLSSGLSIFVARQRDQERTLLAFALVCLSLGIWSGTYLLRVLNPDAAVDLILMGVTHIGIVGAPTSWFVFVLLYTSTREFGEFVAEANVLTTCFVMKGYGSHAARRPL